MLAYTKRESRWLVVGCESPQQRLDAEAKSREKIPPSLDLATFFCFPNIEAASQFRDKSYEGS